MYINRKNCFETFQMWKVSMYEAQLDGWHPVTDVHTPQSTGYMAEYYYFLWIYLREYRPQRHFVSYFMLLKVYLTYILQTYREQIL